MNKELSKLAHELTCIERNEQMVGGWVVQNGVYYYYSPFRALATNEFIKEIGEEYFQEASFVPNLFKLLETENYKRYEIKHDLKQGIKQVAGKCYSHKIIWKQKDMPAGFNPRFILSASKVLKAKYIFIDKWNKPCFMFDHDDPQANQIMMIMPIYVESVTNGFYDISNGERYIVGEDDD